MWSLHIEITVTDSIQCLSDFVIRALFHTLTTDLASRQDPVTNQISYELIPSYDPDPTFL